ncbi:hypothetical protein [Staphylococcus felis]|nr:hypothetical protein [Staphylococcus felis]REH80020.1 hypothetical protein DOS60_00880 [Staphylococcus felis]REI26680.1 hypothetical protein DOS80_10755 [Staphylococcus felis]
MSEENKYVLRHEWEKSRGNIYKKINENDRKHSEALNKLEKTVDRQVLLQQNAFESQKRSEKHLENLNTTMDKIGSEFIEIKYKVKNHEDILNNVKSVISEKQKGNVQITTSIVSGIFAVIAAALGLAHYFF